jgi:hypothetical protein
VVARCLKEGIVGGEAFTVDASMIEADAHRRRSVAKVEDLDPTSSRAVAEYLSVLDDAAFGWRRQPNRRRSRRPIQRPATRLRPTLPPSAERISRSWPTPLAGALSSSNS